MADTAVTATKPKRARQEKFSAAPLGLHLPDAPPHGEAAALTGTVRLGWLRQLVRSIPRAMSDDAAVTFLEDKTSVGG